MKPDRRCAHQELAASRICRIDQCDHGTVHLTLGVVTLRLTPDQLAELAATLGESARQLMERSDTSPTRMLC